MGKQKIVIIGSSYASAAAYHNLEQSLSRTREPAELLWITDKSYYFINELLTQILCDSVSINDVTCGLRSVGIIKPGVSYLQADVKDIDLVKKIVKTNQGIFDYSYLVLAPQKDSINENEESYKRNSFCLNSPIDALQIRTHVQKTLEKAALENDQNKKSSLLTFCVVGPDVRGLEIACALSDYVIHLLKHYYPELYKSQVKIYLIEARQNLFPDKDPFFKTHIFCNLNKKRIQLLLNSKITDFSKGKVLINQEREIESGTVILSASNDYCALMKSLNLRKDDHGNASVNIYLQADGFDDVFVIGDCSKCMDLNETASPNIISTITQAQLCASNILSKINNNPLNPLRTNFHINTMFLGANSSIVDIKGFYLTGILGWLIHRFIYVLSFCGIYKKLKSFVSYLINICALRENSYLDFFEKEKERQILKR